MALVKCGQCGSMVTNTGKCPKCGALTCTECGHVVGKKDVKCPNCGKGTVFLSKKIRAGWICLCFCLVFSWWFIVVLVDVTDKRPQLGITIDVLSIISYVYVLIMGVYNLVKYGVKNRYS